MNRPASQDTPAFSPLALGCWGFADPALWGNTDERDALATIHAALDCGIALIDTAPAYGNGLSEEIVGRALAGRRSDAFVATKVSPDSLTAAGVRTSCEASLRRLQTDCIDLLQIHWMTNEEQFDEIVAEFENLRGAGKIRVCGVCNFGPDHLAKLRKAGTNWVSNQLPYNLLWRAIEFEIAAPCAEDGLGILAYSPLQQGLLAGKFPTAADVPDGRARSRHFNGGRPLSRHGESGCEDETFRAIDGIKLVAERIGRPMSHVAIAWLRAQPGVASIITGATRPRQAVDNARAAELVLDPSVVAELGGVTEELKGKLGPNPDMWSAESRYR